MRVVEGPTPVAAKRSSAARSALFQVLAVASVALLLAALASVAQA